MDVIFPNRQSFYIHNSSHLMPFNAFSYRISTIRKSGSLIYKETKFHILIFMVLCVPQVAFLSDCTTFQQSDYQLYNEWVRSVLKHKTHPKKCKFSVYTLKSNAILIT